MAKPLKLSKERLIEKGWMVEDTTGRRSIRYKGPMWAFYNNFLVGGVRYAWTEDEAWQLASKAHLEYKVLPITKKLLMERGWRVKHCWFWSMQYLVIAPDGWVLAEEPNQDEAWRMALIESERGR